MNTTTELSTREVIALIGSELTDTLVDIDHAHLTYGNHYRFASNTTIYNVAGLRELAAQFKAKAEELEASGALVELSDEEAARQAACARAATTLGVTVAEFEAWIAAEKAERAANPVTYHADSNARQKAETPSRDLAPSYRAPYSDHE